ncbi:hypothetical protein SprV_0100334600 [Sparganum proliferum]
MCASPHTVTLFLSHHHWPDGSPPRDLRDEVPSATPQETISTQQAPNLVNGGPAHFYSFAPILRLSPLPLALPTLYHILLSCPGVEIPKDRRIATAKTKLRLQLYRRPQDNPRSSRPERRTALVARELVRDKVDMAALSKTQFSEKGQLEGAGADYTFVWSGRPGAERRDAGVAFALRNDIVCRRLDRTSPRHLQDADSSTSSQDTPSDELAQRIANFLVVAAADGNASVENRWCQLRE